MNKCNRADHLAPVVGQDGGADGRRADLGGAAEARKRALAGEGRVTRAAGKAVRNALACVVGGDAGQRLRHAAKALERACGLAGRRKEVELVAARVCALNALEPMPPLHALGVGVGVGG